MTESWTPGPWELQDCDQRHVHGKGGWHVTSTISTGADARLIAAAPEMAALLDEIESAPSTAVGDEYRALVTALLSRIRGDA